MLKPRSRNLILSAAAVAAAIYLSADSETPTPEAPRPLKRVRVAAVEPASEHRELRFSGVTRAVRHARLSFSADGRLSARPAEVGDWVRKGAVLALLDDREPGNAAAAARGSLAEVRARRAQAERDVERTRRLVEAKAATEEELERARAAFDGVRAAEEAAKARLDEAERQLGETRLTAPWDGTVTEVHLEPGEYASPGRPVVVLSGDGDLELEVEVPESVVPEIHEGDEVDIRVPFLGETVRTRIDSVGRAAAGPGRLFPVVARIPEASGALAGATAELVLAFRSDGALAVPVEAVVNPGGRRPALFRLTEAGGATRVEKVYVEVGELVGEKVMVRAASLGAGDRVVVGGQRGLLDGEAVEAEE
jgi:RND family efflux transporter MFP subunit